MASTRLHPRRRPVTPTIDDVSESLRLTSLQKGSTFHPSSPIESDLFNPFLGKSRTSSPPLRSATCPKSLEDLLIGAGERRAVDLLRRVDDAIATRTQLSSILSEPEVLPVPRFMVENASLSNNTNEEKKQSATPAELQHQHASDSGLGSSIADSAAERLDHLRESSSIITQSSSAVTKSFSTKDAASGNGLSDFAKQQIHKFIVQPILLEAGLKEFHPLIADVPNKIGTKDITTLRDLEKTLIFLAPDYSRSPAAYKSFCETSIRCLHTAVNNVHDSDRCLPTDRPYSPGYFIDLVEQIRRYATVLAATREKQERGEALDEKDATLTDRIELVGGMTHTGKPALLARTMDGETFKSLADDQPIKSEDVATSSSAKRAMDDSYADDDGARRSMARRKKGAPILTYTCKDAGCGKQFKRPCDLTKHVKTHERPYKCPDGKCKFQVTGFATEKERDRHYNDKHSAAPTMYKCLFKDCVYSSKRESNCKQHMEKSHGWEYERSKNNGKGRATQSVTRLPTSTTPILSDSAISSPFSAMQPSPSDHSLSSNEIIPSADNSPEEHAIVGADNDGMFDFGSGDFGGHFNVDYLTNGLVAPITPAFSDDRRTSLGTEYSPQSGMLQSGNNFEEAMKLNDVGSSAYGAFEYQQPTPTSSYGHASAPHSSTIPNLVIAESSAAAAQRNITYVPHISPGAEDLTFTSPQFYNDVHMDEGYADTGDFQLYPMQSTHDQTLFPTDQAGLGSNMGSQFELMDLFPELKQDKNARQ